MGRTKGSDYKANSKATKWWLRSPNMSTFSGKDSVFRLRMTYNLVIGKRIVIVGNITQLVEIEEKVIDKIEDFSKIELNKLFHPLFTMLEELVYEVTQITLDKKGIALNFTADYD